MLKFKQTVHLEIVESWNESLDKAETSVVVFSPDSLYDGSIIEEVQVKGDTFVDIQFADGTMAFGVNKLWVEEISSLDLAKHHADLDFVDNQLFRGLPCCPVN